MNDDLPQEAFWLKRLYPWLVLPVVFSVLMLVAVIPMTWQQQAIFGVLVVVTAFLIDRRKRGQMATILPMRHYPLRLLAFGNALEISA